MSNGSTEQMKMTAGMDLGDNYSHLCLIHTESGELIEGSRLRTTPEAMRRRFGTAAAYRHRGGNPLALGKSSAYRVWPRGTDR